MKKSEIIKTPASLGKKQLLHLRKSMSKKAYKEYCSRYRCTLTLGRNYGTRQMASARDIARKRQGRILQYDKYEDL